MEYIDDEKEYDYIGVVYQGNEEKTVKLFDALYKAGYAVMKSSQMTNMGFKYRLDILRRKEYVKGI